MSDTLEIVSRQYLQDIADAIRYKYEHGGGGVDEDDKYETDVEAYSTEVIEIETQYAYIREEYDTSVQDYVISQISIVTEFTPENVSYQTKVEEVSE